MLLAILTAALLSNSAQAAPGRPRHGPPGGPHGPMMNNLSEADQKALREYTVTEGNVKKAIALHEKLLAMPEEKRQQFHAHARGAASLDDGAKHMEETPEFASMLKAEGISGHDLLFTSIAMSQATMWSTASQRRPGAQMPPSINPANVEFAAQHPDLAQSWGKVMKQMGGMRPGPGPGRRGPPGADRDAGDKQ